MKLKTKIFFIFPIVIFCLSQINAQASDGCKYPKASNRYLTSQDLAGKSVWDLKVMRNEIFARYGYRFKSEEMREYFNKQKWYKPEYDDVTSKLSEIEIANRGKNGVRSIFLTFSLFLSKKNREAAQNLGESPTG